MELSSENDSILLVAQNKQKPLKPPQFCMWRVYMRKSQRGGPPVSRGTFWSSAIGRPLPVLSSGTEHNPETNHARSAYYQVLTKGWGVWHDSWSAPDDWLNNLKKKNKGASVQRWPRKVPSRPLLQNKSIKREQGKVNGDDGFCAPWLCDFLGEVQ